MDLQLQGRTALVLASSKGLGKACAATLAAEGADVVIGARDAATLEAAAEDIRRTAKGRVLAIPVDVSIPADADKMIEAALSTFGRIDILVNNAGGPPFGRFESFDDEAWQKAFELTLLSAVRWSRRVIPHLRTSGSGRIINVVSLSVKTFLEHSVLSTSLRMGVVGMAKMLSNELGPYNITVNNVAPGFILTDRIKETMPSTQNREGKGQEEWLAERLKDVPLKRIGRPEELAALVAFLASPLAGYITGATIPVDGGSIKAMTP
jgi:3-oxoacyl-[acyl-carrier protein] reductase